MQIYINMIFIEVCVKNLHIYYPTKKKNLGKKKSKKKNRKKSKKNREKRNKTGSWSVFLGSNQRPRRSEAYIHTLTPHGRYTKHLCKAGLV